MPTTKHCWCHEDGLTEFMEEFENENDIDWTEVKVVFDYSGYEA